jgi:5-methylcytosine-specific restriction protein A
MIIKHVKDVIQGKAAVGQKRSSKWPTVRKHHLKSHPSCAVCNGTEVIEVHHIVPYHKNPELELDPNNLITLCESKSYGIVCHRAIGHLGDYKKTNTNVVNDSAYWNKRLTNN